MHPSFNTLLAADAVKRRKHLIERRSKACFDVCISTSFASPSTSFILKVRWRCTIRLQGVGEGSWPYLPSLAPAQLPQHSHSTVLSAAATSHVAPASSPAPAWAVYCHLLPLSVPTAARRSAPATAARLRVQPPRRATLRRRHHERYSTPRSAVAVQR